MIVTSPLLRLSALLAGLTACSTSVRPTSISTSKPQTLSDRAWKTTIRPEPDYTAERAYIQQRRAAVGVSTSAPTLALCFSGGGLRAATLSLGVLRELEARNLLKKVDLLSSVSGGSYTAAWYVSHLLPSDSETVRSQKHLFRGDFESYHGDRAALLQVRSPENSNEGAVDELRERRGFVLGKWNMHLPTLVAGHLATLPPAYLFDTLLHFKPVRGKFNLHHPSYVYDRAIRRTYLTAPASLIPGQDHRVDGPFWGQPHEVRLNEINPPHHPAPYLVINAAIANTPLPSQLFHHRANPFEFSRHSVGAPHLGYIHSDHFGYPVLAADHSAEGTAEVVFRANSIPGLPFTTKPMRLATAVAASGAAGDPNSGGDPQDGVIEWPPGSGKFPPEAHNSKFLRRSFRAQLFNLFTRQQQRNFNMRPPGQPQPPWQLREDLADRLREVTTDRVMHSTQSNTLILTDGGHFDNLGIYAMAQRPHVDEIWAFDVASDPDYDFSNWFHAADLLQRSGWKIEPFGPIQLPVTKPPLSESEGILSEIIPNSSTKGTRVWTGSPVFQFLLTQKSDPTRQIHLFFVKSSYRLEDNHYSTVGAPFDFETYRHHNRHPKTGQRFPHTSTGNVSFNKGDFDAYLRLGQVLSGRLADQFHKP
jgi:hypothetical protein